MDKWQSLIDRQIREALGDGSAAHLPGAGKPLNLDDDHNTPEELRMAYRILRDNQLAPDWMLLAQELDQRREQLRETLRRSAQAYRASKSADPLMQLQAEKSWRAAQDRFRKGVGQFNKLLNTYNLKVPPSVGQKPQLNAEREIQRILAEEAR